MISVLVCTYNQEKYLSQTIESVLMQKCKEPFEILIGDDCSTDHTGLIADNYQERYPDVVRVVRPLLNRGASQNFISLVKAAKGNIIASCDGDDYWLRDDVLQKQLDIFHANPEVGMICAKAKCYIQDKDVYGGTLGYAGAEDLMTMLRDSCDVAAPTIAFRTALMLHCIADSKWYISQNYFYDTVMAYWFAYNSKIKFIDEEFAVYRVLSNSACHAQSSEKEAEYARRYFAVKWHFILTHPDIGGEEIYDILIHDYDVRTAYMVNVAESKVRSSKAYMLGNKIVKFLRKLTKNV